jgi:hypothetical protein
MIFNFDAVYAVTRRVDGEEGLPILAMGVRQAKRIQEVGGPLEDVVEFRRPGIEGGDVSRSIRGDAGERQPSGTVEVVDRKMRNGVKTIWVFRLLTLDMWREMGRKGMIQGYKKMASRVTSTGWLWEHYQDMFPAPWWTNGDNG